MIVMSLQIFNTKNFSLLAPEPFQLCKFRKIYPRCPYNSSVLNKQRSTADFNQADIEDSTGIDKYAFRV